MANENITVEHASNMQVSDKNLLLAAVLAFFLGCFGAHRFYVGKTGSAVVQLFTLGGLGIWALADFLIIVFGEFKDGNGAKIKKIDPTI
ncbi:MAG: TM2 domain-containing protein [Formivibrio sp.]|nr:TM2 domain-containing protein [Formivibrio sp.]